MRKKPEPIAAAPERRSARERLLEAANELFYESGIHTVGIDRVIERAGVAKASLYDTFGSKEALVSAYLEARHAANRARIEAFIGPLATPRERLLGVFDAMAVSMGQPGFRGCAFARAGSESAPSGAVRGACDTARNWMRGLFARLAGEAGVADRGGARDATRHALRRRFLDGPDGAQPGAGACREAGGCRAARRGAEGPARQARSLTVPLAPPSRRGCRGLPWCSIGRRRAGSPATCSSRCVFINSQSFECLLISPSIPCAAPCWARRHPPQRWPASVPGDRRSHRKLGRCPPSRRGRTRAP